MPEPWFPTLQAFAEQMIPTDADPGANEAHTAEQAARVLATAPGHDLTVKGLEALHRLNFAHMTEAQRRDVMERLARGTPPPGWTAADPAPQRFWQLLRGLVVTLFYAGDYGRSLTRFPGPSVDTGGHVKNIVEHPR